MAGVQELQQLIDLIRDLAQQSGSTKSTVDRLAESLEKLIASGRGIQMPSIAWLKEFDQAGTAVGNLDAKYKHLEGTARNVAQAIGQIAHQARQTGVGIGAVRDITATDILRGKGISTELIGSSAQVQAFTQSALEQAKAGFTLDAVLDRLNKQYQTTGVTLEGTKSWLNLTTGEVTVQAKAVSQAGDKWEVFSNVISRASKIGTELPATPGAAMFKERVGAERYEEFSRTLERTGFSMENLTNATLNEIDGHMRLVFRIKEGNNAVRQAVYNFDRWGRVLRDTGTRFKSFDEMIARNTGKVLEWAISVGLVFGTWRQLQESFRDLTTIQDQMASLAVITGTSTREMSNYFDQLGEVARETGTEVTDVMEGMAIALRVGEGATEAERTASAFDFLGDAAAYAKLANIEVSKAADLLVASLSQMGMSINNTEKLLNKWIAVSRNANVSLLDLGQAYATTAGAAADAGVDINELNGYIATMATVTNKSAQESANALRAGFAAIQQPSTQQALLNYGIAIQDVSGNMRDWSDILEDINMLLSTFGADAEGAEEAMSKIAYALGGQGARRQADWVAFLKEQNLAQEQTAISAAASGEVEAALEIKTDTLKTAINELKTAFLELIEAVGTSGGFIDLLTNTVKGLTELMGVIEGITDILGPATTAITAFFLAWAAGYKMHIPERLAAMGTSMMGGAGGGFGAAMAPMFKPGPAPMKTGAVYGAIVGAATGAATGDWYQAAGTGIGTAIGYTLGGPVGGMAGAAIGQVIASTLEESAPYLKQQLGIEEMPVAAGMTREEILGELRYLELGPGVIGDITEAVMRLRPEYKGLSDEDLIRALVEASAAVVPAGVPVSLERSEELITALDNLAKAVEEAKVFGEEAAGNIPYQQAMTRYRAALVPELEPELRERRRELPFEFARGQIGSAREFNAILERTATIGDQLIPVFYALEEASAVLGKPIRNTREEFVDLGMEMVEWSDESVSFIMEQAAALIELQKQGKATTEVFEEFYNILESMRAVEIGRAFGGFPSIQDFGEMTAQEFQTVIEQAREMQEMAMQELGIPDEVLNSIDRWAYHFKNAGDEAYGWMEGLSQQFVDNAIQDLEELKSAQDDTFNVRRLKDVDPSKMGEIAAANRYWIEYLSRLKGMTAQQYLDVEGQQFNLILGEGNVLQQLYSTNEAMLFALQDIKEIEEKQLEGMWNIPSGATFWVPLTSLFYQQGEGGGFPELPELLPPTQRTAEATGETANSTRSIDAKMAQLIDIQRKPGVDYAEFLARVQEIAQPSIVPGETPAWSEWLGEYLGIQKPIGAMAGEDVNHEIWRLTNLAERTIQNIQETGIERRKAIDEPAPALEEPFWLERLFNKLFPGLPEEPPERIAPFPGGRPGEAIEPTIIEPAPVDVNVDVQSEGTFNIRNVVTLDGRVIATYVQRIIADALENTIRSHTDTGKTVR